MSKIDKIQNPKKKKLNFEMVQKRTIPELKKMVPMGEGAAKILAESLNSDINGNRFEPGEFNYKTYLEAAEILESKYDEGQLDLDSALVIVILALFPDRYVWVD